MSVAVLAAAGAAGCAALAAAQLDAAGTAVRDLGRGRAMSEAGQASPPTAGAAAAQGLAAIRGTPVAMRSIAAVVAGTIGLQVGGAVVATMFAGLAVGAAIMRDRRQQRRDEHRRERAAPALARAMADALRGGASVRGALTTAATDRAVPEALRDEATAVARAIAVGSPLTEGLERLAGQGGPTLRLMCGTMAMHLEAGGALATALDRLATDGEAAMRIDEDRTAATAQARATVRVVAALPILALLAAQLTTNQFLQTIAGNPLALGLLILGFVLEATAIMAARVIVGAGR